MAITIIRRGGNGSRTLNKRFLEVQPRTGNTFTVATLPAAAQNVGRVVYVSDASGGACGAQSDGTNWKKITLGATVT